MSTSHAKIAGMLREKQAKDLLRRGFKVQAKAKLLLSGAGSDHPKRINTGQLRSDVRVQLRAITGNPKVRVGTNLKHARWVHDGTGVYGPRKMPIKPKYAKALSFKSGGKRITVRSVKGMKKNEFLKDALPAARD